MNNIELSHHLQSLAGMVDKKWTQPKGHSISEGGDLEELSSLVRDEKITQVIDPIEYIADDLFELHHPDRLDDSLARSAFVGEVLDYGVAFGRWFHFPWSNSLVRYPEKDDHYNLRTYRNKHLITDREQDRLHNSTIAIFGLSVGSNVMDQLHQTGIGNTYVFGDFDTLGPTNLNRIRATMGQVGLQKTVIAARKMSELDPYTEQVHLEKGYDADAETLLRQLQPDILVEEVDNLQTKARIRSFASEMKAPLVSVGDMDERSIIDIERHDHDAVKPFNGRLSQDDFDKLLDGSLEDPESMMIKIIGVRNLSPRLIESAMQRGVDIAGFPQLGATAAAGAVLANLAVREILLDRDIQSGSHVLLPRKVLKTHRPTTLRQDIATFQKFAKRKKS